MKFFILLTLLLAHQEGQLAVIPTIDPDIYRIIYKGDMNWNVEVQLFDEKGRKRFKQTYADSDGFLLPIDMSQEKSGKYTVHIATAAYDLEKAFEHTRYEDRLAERMEIDYDAERKAVTVESSVNVEGKMNVYIYDEDGGLLLADVIKSNSDSFYRVYNMDGAAVEQLEVRTEVNGNLIIDGLFDF